MRFDSFTFSSAASRMTVVALGIARHRSDHRELVDESRDDRTLDRGSSAGLPERTSRSAVGSPEVRVYIEKFDVRVHRLADAQDAVAGRVDTDIFN